MKYFFTLLFAIININVYSQNCHKVKDTLPTVSFAVQLQFDSTVVFENHTEPKDGSNHYSWNFGDGNAKATK